MKNLCASGRVGDGLIVDVVDGFRDGEVMGV